VEITRQDSDAFLEYGDNMYVMGLYISFGQNIHNANIRDAVELTTLGSFKAVHAKLITCNKLLVFLSKAKHRIKKKAEQLACEYAIKLIEKLA